MDEFEKEASEQVERLKKMTQDDLRLYKAGKCTLLSFYENVLTSCGVVIQNLTADKHIYGIIFDDCVNKIWEKNENEPKRP